MPTNITRFRIHYLRPNATIAIIGRRGSGKSTIVRYLLWGYKYLTGSAYVISNTADLNKDYNGMVPDAAITREYNPEMIKSIFNGQSKIRQKVDQGNLRDNIKKMVVIVMDDILSDAKWKNDKYMKMMINDGRHFYFTNILSVQNPQAINNKDREAFDYLIITSASNDNYKKFIYNNYINHDIINNYKQFTNIVSRCTEGYRAMIIDNKKMSTCSNISESIFYLDIKKPEAYKRRVCVSNRFWKIANSYTRKNWKTQYYNQLLGIQQTAPSGKKKSSDLII